MAGLLSINALAIAHPPGGRGGGLFRASYYPKEFAAFSDRLITEEYPRWKQAVDCSNIGIADQNLLLPLR